MPGDTTGLNHSHSLTAESGAAREEHVSPNYVSLLQSYIADERLRRQACSRIISESFEAAKQQVGYFDAWVMLVQFARKIIPNSLHVGEGSAFDAELLLKYDETLRAHKIDAVLEMSATFGKSKEEILRHLARLLLRREASQVLEPPKTEWEASLEKITRARDQFAALAQGQEPLPDEEQLKHDESSDRSLLGDGLDVIALPKLPNRRQTCHPL